MSCDAGGMHQTTRQVRGRPFPKGHPGLGRKRGIPNRTTTGAKEIILALLQRNEPEAQIQLDKLKKRSPREWLKVYLRCAGLLVPRVRDDGNSPLVSINLAAPISNADDAARIYSEIIGRPDADLTGLRFAGPQLPNPNAVETQRAQPLGRDLPAALERYERLDGDAQ